MKNIAVILASGNGERSGLNIPKQFYKINNKTILGYSIDAFEQNENISDIIIVSNPNFIDITKEIIQSNKYKKIKKIVAGGDTRQKSSYNGIFAIEEEKANVLIHDAVRPFITDKIINECIKALGEFNAVNVAIDSSDTIIEIDENNIIQNIPDRKKLKRCQTPQCFDLRLIKKAHYIATRENYYSATDDCSLILRYNLAPVFVVDGDINNIKITYPFDLVAAENYLKNIN